ncbi:transposase [Salmonella enterica]|nr:transposase [Salmonella enterica]EGS1738201.1 transposase [Salmonella enterica]
MLKRSFSELFIYASQTNDCDAIPTAALVDCQPIDHAFALEHPVANLKRDGKLLSPDLLAHVSPLGWEHINLTGEYRWPKP